MKMPALVSLFSFLFSFELLAIRIGIVTRATFYGEREMGWRIKWTAEQLGWEAFLDEEDGASLNAIADLDWVICLVPRSPNIVIGCPNYMVLFHDVGYFDPQGKLNPFYKKYDGFLLTIPQNTFDKALLSAAVAPPSAPFYPSVPATPYKRLALDSAVTMMPVWGNRLKDAKYISLYRMLSESGWTKFYGAPDRTGAIAKGYMGPLPFDGTSVIPALQQHGIALVLHAQRHLKAKIPSGRIFEAAAASAVIICDENQFVKKHFQDSIYYIDTAKSSEEIYQQIEQCMNAILQNPEAALQKAARAHQIFEEKFSLQNQLLQIQEMHCKFFTEKKTDGKANESVTSDPVLFSPNPAVQEKRGIPDNRTAHSYPS